MKNLTANDLTENDSRTLAIIGAAMEVYRLLGCGFLEPVYQAALMLEFAKREIPFSREVKLPVFGRRLLEYKRFIVSPSVSSA